MTRDKLSLNLVTIRPAPFVRKLQAASQAGFSAVGLWWDEYQGLGEEELGELELSGLAVSELVGVRGWMDPDRTERTIALARAEEMSEAAGRMGAPVLVAEAGWQEDDVVEIASHFRELCRVAAPYSVRVGLHFHGRAATLCDLAAAWQVVEAADAENGGLVLDIFEYHRGGSTLEMLEPVPADRILLVQVADCVDLARHELEDGHRVYPGAGALPVEVLVGALRDKGYEGYYSLELLNEDYWQEDPVVVARDGIRALRRVCL